LPLIPIATVVSSFTETAFADRGDSPW
jgi:hypothetical protein